MMPAALNTPPASSASAPVGAAARRAVNLVVIHCSATPSGKSIQQGEPNTPGYKNCAEVIDGWHAARGFLRAPAAVQALSTRLPHIGYHYLVDLNGTVWTGRGLDEVGAHALNFNAQSVGICLVGGAEREGRYTTKQWESLRQVVCMLLVKYGIPRAAPKRVYGAAYPGGYAMYGGVCGHRDLSPDKSRDGLIESFEWLKTCPGFDVQNWLSTGMTPEPKNVWKDAP